MLNFFHEFFVQCRSGFGRCSISFDMSHHRTNLPPPTPSPLPPTPLPRRGCVCKCVYVCIVCLTVKRWKIVWAATVKLYLVHRGAGEREMSAPELSSKIRSAPRHSLRICLYRRGDFYCGMRCFRYIFAHIFCTLIFHARNHVK